MKIDSWLSAHDFIGKARKLEEGRPLGKETRLVVSRKSATRYRTDETVYAVRYHYTEVVRFYPNGNVGVDLDGWESKTTKQRVSDFTNMSIYSADGAVGIAWMRQGQYHYLPINSSKEYVRTPDGTMITPEGHRLESGVEYAPRPQKVSATRNRLTTPIAGEVLTDPDGNHFLVRKTSPRRGHVERTRLTLQQYFGDYALDDNYAFLGEKTMPLNELMALTLTDWASTSRFIRSFDN